MVMHLLKMVVSGSAIIEEVFLRNRAEILSNPTAFETANLLSSCETYDDVTVFKVKRVRHGFI